MWLEGKTKHGKNRIREQGAEWDIVRVFRNKHTKRVCLDMESKQLDSRGLPFWRIVELWDDRDFIVHNEKPTQ